MRVDVCVVGAGPAGLAASALLARHGRRVVVVDESPEPGGRLLGQLHRVGHRTDAYHEKGWWNGRRIASKLADEAGTAGVSFLSGTSVWGIYPGWRICVAGNDSRIIEADTIVLATGATEVPLPIPGWTLPGVMTIGAAQVLAVQHRVLPGQRGIVVGINPLSLAIANELRMAGTELAGIVNSPPGPLSPPDQDPASVLAELARVSYLAPSRLLRWGGRFGRSRWLAAAAARAISRTGLRVWGVPLHPGRAVTRINGGHQVESVVVSNISAEGDPAREREVPVDAVFLAAGLRPLHELAMLAGCEVARVPELGGTVPLHGPALETTAAGVWVAGNMTGIESASVAIAQGELAAAAIAAPPRVETYQQRLVKARREAAITFQPQLALGRARVTKIWDARLSRDAEQPASGRPFPACVPSSATSDVLRGLDDDLVLCRCENVTVGTVRGVARQGFTSAEEIKRFTRMTMGTCQGRVCQSILERVQVPDDMQGLPGHRPPVRPIALGVLADLANGDEEWERLHGGLLPSVPFDAPGGDRLGDPRL